MLEFREIRAVGIDEEKTLGDIREGNIYIILSDIPSIEWIKSFQESWKRNRGQGTQKVAFEDGILSLSNANIGYYQNCFHVSLSRAIQHANETIKEETARENRRLEEDNTLRIEAKNIIEILNSTLFKK